jgi:hypothetical protein
VIERIGLLRVRFGEARPALVAAAIGQKAAAGEVTEMPSSHATIALANNGAGIEIRMPPPNLMI